MSERIISDFLSAAMRILREALLLEMVQENDKEDDEDTFYDVRSEFISEDDVLEDEIEDLDNLIDYDLDSSNELFSQLKLIPGLSKSINQLVYHLLEQSYKSTRSYLQDYCEMQKETIYCREEEYIKAFKDYYKMNKKKSLSAMSLSGLSVDLLTEELPMNRIDLEEEVVNDFEKIKPADNTGILKEFLSLLFPPVNTMKRVEYRPRRSINSSATSNVIKPAAPAPTTKSSDEVFLLKILQIYLKSYHRQLTDFLPKCINYHLIGRIERELPLRLLVREGSQERLKRGNDRVEKEIKRIERVLRIIDQINS